MIERLKNMIKKRRFKMNHKMNHSKIKSEIKSAAEKLDITRLIELGVKSPFRVPAYIKYGLVIDFDDEESTKEWSNCHRCSNPGII